MACAFTNAHRVLCGPLEGCCSWAECGGPGWVSWVAVGGLVIAGSRASGRQGWGRARRVGFTLPGREDFIITGPGPKWSRAGTAPG